jgi:tetratricopeptide (TPR) repeat protein
MDAKSGHSISPVAGTANARLASPGQAQAQSTAPALQQRAPEGANSTKTKENRFPRRGLMRGLRRGLLYAWAALVLYATSALFNLYLLFFGENSPPPTLERIVTALALPNFLTRKDTPLWVDAISAAILLAVIAGYQWARKDDEAEKEWRLLPKIVPPLPSPVQTPKGAPFDLTVLPSPQHFIGREGTLNWLLGRLDSNSSPAVTALRGTAGIGKSTTANAVIQRLKGRYDGGIAVVLCEGLIDPVVVLRKALARFDPQRDEPKATDLSNLAEAARDLLGGKHALIVLDNVEPTLDLQSVVTPLRSAGGIVLLTARQVLPSEVVPDRDTHEVESLSSDEALELFAVSLGRSGHTELNADERKAALRIVNAVNHHTLAVQLAGAYAHKYKRPLAKLADELENPESAIKLPDQQTPEAVGKVFAQSTKNLAPEALQLFQALGAFATNELGQEAVLALAGGLRLPEPERHVDSLVALALVDKQLNPRMPEDADNERLRLHPLLHAFAKMGFDEWTQERRTIVLDALAEHFAAYVNATSAQAFAADERNIAGALEWAYKRREDDVVARLCLGMCTFWRDRWRILAARRYLPSGIEAAERIAAATGRREDHLRAADISLIYGEIVQNIGEVEEAKRIFQANLTKRHEQADRRGEGRVLVLLGERAYLDENEIEAETDYRRALELLAGEVDHESLNSRCDALVYLGELTENRGDFGAAQQYYDQGLGLSQQLHNTHTQSTILANQGRMALRQGHLDHAKDYYTRCLALAQEHEDGRAMAFSQLRLGDIALLFNRLDEAGSLFAECLEICSNKIHDPAGEGVALDRLGRIAQARGELGVAEGQYQRSLSIATAQNPRGKGEVLTDLGRLAQAHDDFAAAERWFTESLAVARRAGDRRNEGIVLMELGRLSEARGVTPEAIAYYRQGLEALVQVQDALHLPTVQIALGVLLASDPHTHDEGCVLLTEATQRYRTMGLPDEERARDVAQRLGCMQ